MLTDLLPVTGAPAGCIGYSNRSRVAPGLEPGSQQSSEVYRRTPWLTTPFVRYRTSNATFTSSAYERLRLVHPFCPATPGTGELNPVGGSTLTYLTANLTLYTYAKLRCSVAPTGRSPSVPGYRRRTAT